MDKRTVLITGASSGIGLAAAELFLKNGDSVYALSRRDCPAPGAVSLHADVTDGDAVREAIDEVFRREGRLDVLVLNAGFGISGAVEFTGLSEAKRQLDVNFFGTASCIRHALPHMREQGSGHILIISSVAGAIPIPFQAYYSCSKAALNALVLAAANELRPFNIHVAAVLPGDIKTGFTEAREKNASGASVYAALDGSIKTMEQDERRGMPPSAIAKKLYSLSKKKSPKPLSTVGLKYKLFLALAKLLPVRFTNRIVGMLYAGKK